MPDSPPPAPRDPAPDSLDEVQWTEDYSVGVRSMDEQHKVLLSLLNQLLGARDLRADSEPVSDALQRMTRYAQEHFQAEEALLREGGYPGIEEHRAQHQAFLGRTVEFCLDASRSKAALPEDMLRFLRMWWVHHILDEDRRYGFELGYLPSTS